MMIFRTLRFLFAPERRNVLWPGTTDRMGKYHVCHVILDVETGSWGVFDGDTLTESRVHDWTGIEEQIRRTLFNAARKFGF
jgi:hypothetical protein